MIKNKDSNPKLSKRIRLGKQTFEFLIKNNFLYVDKTKDIYNLIYNESTVFLSRPRRFGKSLLVSTLDNLFLGNKDLFKGLYIYDKWDWSKKYTVINIDLSKPFNEDNEQFKESLNFYLNRIAKHFSIDLIGEHPNDKLSELIEELYYKHNNEIVVLVDEYDAPILDNINNEKLADANRKTLQSFFMSLKNSDKYINFIFITGITKFAHTSIFSKLNNPTDITLSEEYSTICGITHRELEYYCSEYIQTLADKKDTNYTTVLAKINNWYDGYSFDGKKRVFNPFSTLTALKTGKLSHFWFKTGTPHFLVDILKNRREQIINFENIILNERDLNEIDPINMEELPLLFQGGYLTIDKMFINDNDEIEYSLKIPNFEVEQAFKYNLTELYMKRVESRFKSSQEQIWNEIISGKCGKLSESLRAYISGVPYFNRISMYNEEKWKVYSMIFTIWAESMDFYMTEERVIEDGRIDFVLENNEKEQTLIVEMKYTADQTKTLDNLINEAFKQIEHKKYWWAYTGKIKLMALALKDVEIDDGFITDVKCRVKDVLNRDL
ncbi:MAG: AAA family ATPase [Methanobrevibacter sp. CfCl-M3]